MKKVLHTDVFIPLADATLTADLSSVDQPAGLVIFSHGSGSSRLSPRNRFVAEELNKNGLATLLVDLLTTEEDRIYENRFDIDLLTDRLTGVARWTEEQPGLVGLDLGFFGASTGAASALRTAAFLSDKIKALVSRGGRPDLAMQALPDVQAPVLLIVGSLDGQVIELNRRAFQGISSPKKLEIVDGASHLFQEPGKLEEVARLAAGWFGKYLVGQHAPTG